MNVTILIGSVRKERQSIRLAQYLQEQLLKRGKVPALIDLAQTPLPIYGQEGGDLSHVKTIGEQLEQSDALIFVSPEYHGSFSGALKNALDYYWAEFQRKPIGVATASAGRMSGINASTQLQHVILSVGAYPLPKKLLVPEINTAFGDGNQPLNQKLVKDTAAFLDEFLWFADAIKAKKTDAVPVA